MGVRPPVATNQAELSPSGARPAVLSSSLRCSFFPQAAAVGRRTLPAPVALASAARLITRVWCTHCRRWTGMIGGARMGPARRTPERVDTQSGCAPEIGCQNRNISAKPMVKDPARFAASDVTACIAVRATVLGQGRIPPRESVPAPVSEFRSRETVFRGAGCGDPLFTQSSRGDLPKQEIFLRVG